MAVDAVDRAGVATAQQTIDAIRSGKMSPNKWPHRYGWKTHEELCRVLGLPAPVREHKRCPHCGAAVRESELIPVPATPGLKK